MTVSYQDLEGLTRPQLEPVPEGLRDDHPPALVHGCIHGGRLPFEMGSFLARHARPIGGIVGAMGVEGDEAGPVELEEDVKAALRRSGARFAIVHGSRAGQGSRPGSDLDVAACSSG